MQRHFMRAPSSGCSLSAHGRQSAALQKYEAELSALAFFVVPVSATAEEWRAAGLLLSIIAWRAFSRSSKAHRAGLHLSVERTAGETGEQFRSFLGLGGSR